MAPSFVSRLCACAVTAAFGLVALAQDNSDRAELLFDSKSVTFDRQSNMIQLLSPRLTQGDLQIGADEALASGADLESASEWRFTGNVHIEAGRAVMDADSAVFKVDEGRLSRGELQGAPASFTDLDPAREKPLSGTARNMSYDATARTLRMTDAFLQRDQTEITGCDLIYNFATENLASGDADCENPFRLRRIAPEPAQRDEPDPPR